MIIALIFALGVGNFAMHKAVLESGHSMVRQLPGGMGQRGAQVTLVLEFAILLGAMLFAANGWPNAAYAYVFYTGLNGASAWMILTGKM